MKKIFFKIPETPAEIRAKISYLEDETDRLTFRMENLKTNILANHLNFSHTILKSKKQALEDLKKKIGSNQSKIKSLKSKLPGGKSTQEPKYPF
jgi:chromosome segregation ATPase